MSISGPWAFICWRVETGGRAHGCARRCYGRRWASASTARNLSLSVPLPTRPLNCAPVSLFIGCHSAVPGRAPPPSRWSVVTRLLTFFCLVPSFRPGRALPVTFSPTAQRTDTSNTPLSSERSQGALIYHVSCEPLKIFWNDDTTCSTWAPCVLPTTDWIPGFPACSGQEGWHSCRAGYIVIPENPQGLATHMVHAKHNEQW